MLRAIMDKEGRNEETIFLLHHRIIKLAYERLAYHYLWCVSSSCFKEWMCCLASAEVLR